MSFRSRLARLGQTQGAGARADQPEQTLTSTLERLRRSLDRSLGRAKKKESAPPDGFSQIETPDGPLFVRQARFGEHATLGSHTLKTAESVSPHWLALLALDPKVAHAETVKFLYLDTETTGLSHGAGTVPFLIGLAFWAEGELIVEQLLLMNFGQELPILKRILDRISRASALVTFNGKSFDWPLLRTRAVLQKMHFELSIPHVDLVHIARRIHRDRNLECTLSTLERELLNFVRESDVGGAAIPALYTEYLRNRKAEGLLGVVAHNEFDMCAMVALVGLYGAPVTLLGGLDLAGVARTFRRAGAHDQAHEVANHAATTFGTALAFKERALAEKARGNRGSALRDFETFVAQVDDPEARLELAKLYEHFLKSPEAALKIALQGTSEPENRAEERRSRLERKARRRMREGQPVLPGIVIDRDPCRTAKNR